MKRITEYLPEMLILFLCGLLLLGEIRDKQGYHMDELLSFELANAQFNPWIVPTQPQGRLAKFVENEIKGENAKETVSNLIGTVEDVFQNRGNSKLLSYKADVYEEPVWIDRKTFTDYITVDEEDDFNYLSVYFNVKDDNHPPLHFMVLHTVSSVFKGQITPLMGCAVNLLCVLGIMALLMKLCRQIMKLWGIDGCFARMTGNAAAILYGLSAGALSTTLLIRMYAMVAFFCVALLAVHMEKIYGGGDGFLKKNGLLILVTICGFWTQYFFLFYCLIMAAVTAVILWREKRMKELWRYIRSMTAAALIGVCVFPFAVSDVFSSGRGVEALENLSSGLAGYGTRLWVFLRILASRTGVWCVAALLLLIIISVISAAVAAFRTGRETFSRGSLWMLLLLPFAGYFLLAARMAPYLVDRYIMPVFPVGMLILVTASFRGIWTLLHDRANGAKKERAAVGALMLFLGFCQVLSPDRYEDTYLYTGYAGQEKIAGEYADRPCICVYEGVGYYENLVEFTRYDRTLLVTMDELLTRRERDSISSLGEVVVILKKKEEEQQLFAALQDYGLELEKVLWDGAERENDEVLLFTGTGRKME